MRVILSRRPHLKNLLFKAGFFSSGVYEDENLRRGSEVRILSRRPHLKNLLLKQVFFRLEFMRMRTSEGGLSRAKRDHVALATARRASIEDARNPLSPTTFEKPAF